MTFGESRYGEEAFGEPPAGGVTVAGEVATLAAVGLSGSALTAISVAGSVATLTATALDGTATSGPITVSGSVATLAATALDGSALTAIRVAGEVASLAALANVGTVMLGPVPGSVAVMSLVALDGGVVFDTGTDTSNVFNGRSRSGTATVELVIPVAATPAGTTRGTRVDKAVPLPLPTLVNGRPT